MRGLVFIVVNAWARLFVVNGGLVRFVHDLFFVWAGTALCLLGVYARTTRHDSDLFFFLFARHGTAQVYSRTGV
jgi:hypothetical protein